MEFSIVSYNVALSIGPPISFNGAFARVPRIADAFYTRLRNTDVVLLQELVVHRSSVLKSFVHHPFCTEKVSSQLFSDNIRFLSSGLAIVSKWPIVKERSLVFDGDSYHMEKFMSKAVLYVELDTDFGPVHVFNTHCNAWSTPKAKMVREVQAQKIDAFIKSLCIPRDQYVFLGGDLNIDVYEHKYISDHIAQLMGGFLFTKPKEIAFSSDPLLNSLVGTDDANEYKTRSRRNGCYSEFMEFGQCLCCPRQLIDLIGVKSSHKQPLKTEFTIVPVKSRVPFPIYLSFHRERLVTDVSDHFPVVLRAWLEKGKDTNKMFMSPKDYKPATENHFVWVCVVLIFTVAFSVISNTVCTGAYRIIQIIRNGI